MKHTLKEWIATTRYWSFSVSALPVVATTAYLCTTREVTGNDLLCALLAVVGVVLFHAAGNLLSDVGDFRSGADSREAFAIPNLVEHIFEPKEYLRLSAVLFTLGIAVGLLLTWLCGWQLLVIGGIGFLLTLLYTKSKNCWLSDLDVFVIFGVLIVLGTSFVVTRQVCLDSLLLSVPLGFITLSVLHANNTVDIETDRAAGLHTLAMAMGVERAAKVYICYQIIPFVWIVGCVLLGYMPWTALICLVSLVAAVGNIRQAAKAIKRDDRSGSDIPQPYGKHSQDGCSPSKERIEGREAMMGLDLRSAKLQLLFSLTLAVGLFLAAILK